MISGCGAATTDALNGNIKRLSLTGKETYEETQNESTFRSRSRAQLRARKFIA